VSAQFIYAQTDETRGTTHRGDWVVMGAAATAAAAAAVVRGWLRAGIVVVGGLLLQGIITIYTQRR